MYDGLNHLVCAVNGVLKISLYMTENCGNKHWLFPNIWKETFK
jgi:hypothetical protein